METSRLPTDIFALLLTEHLAHELPTVAAIAQTCHELQAVAERALYKSINLIYGSQRAIKICMMLQRRTAEYAREVTIVDVVPGQMCQWNLDFTNLEAAGLFASALVDRSSVPPFESMNNLRSLVIRHSEVCAIRTVNVSAYLNLFHSLARFQGSLETFYCDVPLHYTIFPVLKRQASSIKYLQLNSPSPEMLNLPSFPNLRMLHTTKECLAFIRPVEIASILDSRGGAYIPAESVQVFDFRDYAFPRGGRFEDLQWGPLEQHLVALDLGTETITSVAFYDSLSQTAVNLKLFSGFRTPLFDPAHPLTYNVSNELVQILTRFNSLDSICIRSSADNAFMDSALIFCLMALNESGNPFKNLKYILHSHDVEYVSFERIKNTESNEWIDVPPSSRKVWWHKRWKDLFN